MRSDGQKVKFKAAKNFTVKTTPDGCLIYEFVLEASAPVVLQNKLEVFFFDKTIYTAFDESVSVIGDKYPLSRK